MRQNALAGLLARELQTLRDFLTLLGREQTLLSQGTADPLPSLAAEKSAMASKLAHFAVARDTELGRLGLPTGRPGMDAWASSPAGIGHQADWNHLLALAAEARSVNETNGKLIGMHLQHNQQAMRVLMAAVDQAVTYGPDGQQKSGTGGRSLGSA